MKHLISVAIAAIFAAVTFTAAAQAPAPSSDTPAATEKKAKKAKKSKAAKKSKKDKAADAPAAPAAPK